MASNTSNGYFAERRTGLERRFPSGVISTSLSSPLSSRTIARPPASTSFVFMISDALALFLST